MYKTILVDTFQSYARVTLNRPEQQNSINSQMLKELHLVLDQVEQNSTIRILLLTGKADVFCTGLDLKEVSKNKQEIEAWATEFIRLLKRFTNTSKVIGVVVDGKAIAGGLGLIAASDWAIATQKSTFKLTEGLWELLPAMIAPFLIRRMGFQQTYSMTLTCRGITAQEAFANKLLDEIEDNVEQALEKLIVRIGRVKESTILEAKQYFNQLHPISDETEQNAIREFTKLMLQKFATC